MSEEDYNRDFLTWRAVEEAIKPSGELKWVHSSICNNSCELKRGILDLLIVFIFQPAIPYSLASQKFGYEVNIFTVHWWVYILSKQMILSFGKGGNLLDRFPAWFQKSGGGPMSRKSGSKPFQVSANSNGHQWEGVINIRYSACIRVCASSSYWPPMYTLYNARTVWRSQDCDHY